MWGKAKPFLGIIFRGAQWYVKARYSVDVDRILKESQANGTQNDRA